ncbi:MAG: site-2 protease family protein [Planctomycetes bacterium]|nr:site-2 protease family protein [Planctomycetota bacterium]
MTMNPLVHMGGMSLIVFAVIGIAWGLMPTDPSKYRWRRQGRIIVAGAGPAMNILLALVCLTAASLWVVYGSQNQPLSKNVSVFLSTGGWLNIVLAMFNLLPIPPLDGSSILSGLSFKAYRFYQNPKVQTYGFLVLLAVFISGIGSFLFGFAMTLSNAYVNGLAALLP